MALLKVCDNPDCGKELGGDEPFVQTKGSVSDQYEPTDGGQVKFRYLTKGERDEVHTFCNDICEHEWREDRRANRIFFTRS
jgi:hypothetical protein